MKIEEPKTPYIHYDPDTDEVRGASRENLLDVNALDIGKPAMSEKLSSSLNSNDFTSKLQKQATDDSSQQHSFPTVSVTVNEPSEWDVEDEIVSSSSDHIDHSKFDAKRAEHYKMGNALKLGRMLLEEEDEDE